MYRHPEVQYAELGLGGSRGHLVVWLLGTEWTAPQVKLGLLQWYSLCLTWSHLKDRPALYINGNLVDMTAGGIYLGFSHQAFCSAHVIFTSPSFVFYTLHNHSQ